MHRRTIVIASLLLALAFLSIGRATPTNPTSPASQEELAALEARVDTLEADLANASLQLDEVRDRQVVAVPRTSDDVFLEVADIPGGSRDEEHANEIDVIGWAWGPAFEADGRLHKPLVVTKGIDRASPPLHLASLREEVLFGARLYVRQPGETGFEYLRIEILDVVVTSVATHSTCDGGSPCETIVLDGLTLTQTYTPQNEDGTAGTPVTITWPEEAA